MGQFSGGCSSEYSGQQFHQPSTPQNRRIPFFPGTPQEKKIVKIIKNPLFKDASNAGRLAIALACNVFFSTEILAKSSLGGSHGKYKPLDEDKLKTL